MQTTLEHDAPPPPPPAGEQPLDGDPAPRLRRSRTRRMLAGVAGGISQRYDVDVSLVRVAFVVLACAWGLGIVLYAAMWALVPRQAVADEEAPGEKDAEPTSPWLAYLLLAGVLAFGLLVASSWWGGPRWGGAVGLLWLILLFGLLAVAIVTPSGRIPIRRALGVLALVVLSLVILVTGAFLALVASTGVPIAGGIGDRVDVPESLAQVQPTYRLAVGALTVDLDRVHFSGAPRRVTVSVAVGVVTVDVPPGVVVAVTAHSGVGNVVTSAGSVGDFGDSGAPADAHAAPELLLTVDAGVGQVRLNRGDGQF